MSNTASRRKDKLKEERITIRQMIGNVTYLLKYAGKYDRPLILRIMILNILLLFVLLMSKYVDELSYL